MDKQQLSKKASLLHLSSLRLATGMKNGNFKSLYYGHGIEFSGVREYLPGDDVRAIDWNVTARMSKPFVQMYEEERELDVFLVVDKSLSMNTGSGRQSRMETALECASLLTLASFQNSSPIGAVTFDGDISFSCSPKAGKTQAMMLLSQFNKMSANSIPGSALDSALKGAQKLLHKSTLLIIISDFRTSGWEDSFARLCQKNDVVAIRITDSIDEKLPSVGSVPFVDPETNYSVVLPTSSNKFLKIWRKDNEERIETWKNECLRRGGIPLCINTSSDCANELIKFFTVREKSK